MVFQVTVKTIKGHTATQLMFPECMSLRDIRSAIQKMIWTAN
jgi:hypothetical protein